MFKKILIANRGEIAVRIIRALREMKITSVAIYSDVDEKALHRQMADEAYSLGDPRPSESYLNIAKIIEIAKKAQVDAIHPGYGFLSERAEFAEACQKEGIVFIGPSPEAIRVMGDKIGAKVLLKKHRVPLIPGVEEAIDDLKKAQKIAGEIGYPVLLKAAAGGGGKGMRVVREEKGLQEALEGAQREAKGAFGDSRVFIEKYIQEPRHIEIQIVADREGNTIHLFERECSIQRRHQKIIEETPSVALDAALREKMGETAIRIAKAIGYESLGTIEFILDQEKNFYFLEVNTRLQVEHPVTEMVTGIDLVKMQVRIAAGERLDVVGAGLKPAPTGHSIECRIYAEDPEHDFLPSIGKITHLREPVGEGIRVDSGIYEGWMVPMEYDPMLAKLIVHAPTRERAILKMIQALGDYEIGGIRTNVPFLIDLLRHPAVLEGKTETHLIQKYFSDWFPSEFLSEDPFSPWTSDVGWRLSEQGKELGDEHEKEARAARKREFLASHRPHVGGVEGDPVAPMPGTVRKIFVQEGAVIQRGTPLVVIEAMKMEHSIEASRDGTIKKILFQVGDKVAMGEKLVEIS